MSEPPASSDFTSRARRSAAKTSLSSSLPRRADPPSDPPDSRNITKSSGSSNNSSKRLVSSSAHNGSNGSSRSSRGIATPTATATVTSISSPSSAKRSSVEPPPTKTVSPITASKRRDAPATTRPPDTSGLPTFKGQVSGGSILRIEGKKVASHPPVISEQAKQAMEEARQQHLRVSKEPVPVSIATDKASNRLSNRKTTTPPLVEQPPPQIQTSSTTDFTKNLKQNSSKNLKNNSKPLDVDDAKSVTLVETSKKEISPPNPNTEIAPQIPSQFQKKTTAATTTTTPPPPSLAVQPNKQHQPSGLLEEAWEFDIAPKQASTSSCCIIS